MAPGGSGSGGSCAPCWNVGGTPVARPPLPSGGERVCLEYVACAMCVCVCVCVCDCGGLSRLGASGWEQAGVRCALYERGFDVCVRGWERRGSSSQPAAALRRRLRRESDQNDVHNKHTQTAPKPKHTKPAPPTQPATKLREKEKEDQLNNNKDKDKDKDKDTHTKKKKRGRPSRVSITVPHELQSRTLYQLSY